MRVAVLVEPACRMFAKRYTFEFSGIPVGTNERDETTVLAAEIHIVGSVAMYSIRCIGLTASIVVVVAVAYQLLAPLHQIEKFT